MALETSSQPRGVPERCSRVYLYAQFWRGSKHCSGHVSKIATALQSCAWLYCRSNVGAMSTTHHVYDRRRGHAAVTPRNRDLGDLSSRFHTLLHTLHMKAPTFMIHEIETLLHEIVCLFYL